MRFGRIQILADVDGVLRRLELIDKSASDAIDVTESSDALLFLYRTKGTV